MEDDHIRTSSTELIQDAYVYEVSDPHVMATNVVRCAITKKYYEIITYGQLDMSPQTLAGLAKDGVIGAKIVMIPPENKPLHRYSDAMDVSIILCGRSSPDCPHPHHTDLSHDSVESELMTS